MPGICRQGDTLTTGHLCDTFTTLDAPSNTTVRVNGFLVARVGDPTLTHNHQTGTDEFGDPICTPHIMTISSGSETVSVEGAKVARIGDNVSGGTLTTGSLNVFSG